MERQDARDEANFREMCETFTAETKEYCGQLHQIFVKSLNHVHQTLDVLMHFSLDHKVLDQGTSDDSAFEPKFDGAAAESRLDGADSETRLDGSR